MTDETAELNRLAGRAVSAMVAGSAGFHARMGPDWTLALCGESVADLNMLFIGPAPAPEAVLKESVGVVQAADLPLLTLLTPHVAAELAPVAEALGLSNAGILPLMVLRPRTPIVLGKPCEIEPVRDAHTAAIAGDLVAAAFDLPRDAVARGFDASLTETSGLEAFIGSWDGVPMGAVTLSRTGSTVGVWSMATPPEHQGKGMGRALLTRVLELQRAAGVSRFYLGATSAGQGLYESIGFETLADWSAWVRSHSTQVGGR